MSTSFSGMVGQACLRSALLLGITEPRTGGVLISGEPGTGKSSAVRAMRGFLPQIDVVAGCPVNCQPSTDAVLCPSCAEIARRGDQFPVRRRPVPFVTLPVGATEDRLLGTLDLARALADGQRLLSPGILASANRGILYIDEVNLIADHLLDALLDAASSGVHVIERDGISASHPAKFCLIGTMNRTEGWLRPQLLDRFGLSVESEFISDPSERIQILITSMNPDAGNGMAETPGYGTTDRLLAERIQQAKDLIPAVRCSPETLARIVSLSCDLGVASHRADLAMLTAATANAALGGRAEVRLADVGLAAVFALRHRVDDPEALVAYVCDRLLGDPSITSVEQLARRYAEPREVFGPESQAGPPPGETRAGSQGAAKAMPPPPPPWRDRHPGAGGRPHTAARGTDDDDFFVDLSEPGTARSGWSGITRLGLAEPTALATRRSATCVAPMLRAVGRSGGHPSSACRDGAAGLAFYATIFRATLRVLSMEEAAKRLPLRPQPSDVMKYARVGRPNLALIAVLDASWSMAMAGVFRRAKFLLGQVLRCGQRSDCVAIITVAGSNAAVTVPLTRHLQHAADVVEGLRARGCTPLIDGLELAIGLCREQWRFRGRLVPVVLVITDGRDNQRDTAVEAAELSRLAAKMRQLMVTGVVLAPDTCLDAAAETNPAYLLAKRFSWHYQKLPVPARPPASA